ncbi:MAG TPA: hypothetical protein VFY28_01665 [Candidatus Paceibacterota bacterium]|nr:hypothetical protein [Candidatus Paceibacterota bacterium]
MDIFNKSRLPWIVSGVLAVLLIIMTVLWGRASGAFTLDARDLEAERERLTEVCQTSEDLSSRACREALDDLAGLLQRFENRLQREARDAQKALESATIEVSTTTAPAGQ